MYIPTQDRQGCSLIMNLIVYVLWGTHLRYLGGMIDNVHIAPSIYPGWVIKIYADDNLPAKYLKYLQSYTHVDVEIRHNPTSNPWHCTLWGLEPFDDVHTTRFISRDADSILSKRESGAVYEWIKSGLPFHVMRDHPQHGAKILRGMFGSIGGLYPGLCEYSIDMNRNPPSCQGLLGDVLWPTVKNKTMAHDDFFDFEEPERRLLPGHRNNDNYIGRKRNPSKRAWRILKALIE